MNAPQAHAQFEGTRAPLMAHLIELRTRLMVYAVALLIGVCVSYSYSEVIYQFLTQPLEDSFSNPESRRMIYTGLSEAFMTYMKLALFGGFFLSFPVLAWQLYCFIAPGLYAKEKHVFAPFLVAAPVLFLLGAALAYYFVIPLAWKFFLGFETTGAGGGVPIMLEARVAEYLDLVMHIIIAFGVAFQLPVVLTLLAMAGVIKGDMLVRGRRYAIVIIVTVAGILTPPDVLSQIGLSIPLYLLYECSIIACRWVQRRDISSQEEMPHA